MCPPNTITISKDESVATNGVATIGKGVATNGGSTTSENEKETTSEMLQRWYKLLFTKEDYLHHHKILGILAISSFLFRFILFFIYDDMGFKEFPYLTVPTLLLHLSLNLSSFQFKIPIRRIRDGGRIWPQYRYHAIIFAMRSVLLISARYYEDNFQQKIDPKKEIERSILINFIIVMSTMAGAEFVNYAVGKEQRSNTIRELDGNPYLKFFFSTMQFNSTAVLMMSTSYMVPYYALFTLQITPFVGTLRRKMIFTSNTWGAFVYGALIVVGTTIHSISYHKAGGAVFHMYGRTVALYAAFFRFTSVIPYPVSILQSKFVLWTVGYMAALYYHRSIDDGMNVAYLRILLAIAILLLGLTARHKVMSGYYPKDVKDAKLMKSSDGKSA